MREIAGIIHHLHSKNIAHRDLKPENFLYTEKGGGVLKLADFGFAKVDHGDLTTPVFTPYYVPKEILEAQNMYHKKKAGEVPQSAIYAYDKSCDMWSLGVILYIMLCGYPPFQSEIPGTQLSANMKANIASANFAFHKPHWGHISEAAKSLVSALLTSESTNRITAEQLVLHPWLQVEQLEEILSGLGSADTTLDVLTDSTSALGVWVPTLAPAPPFPLTTTDARSYVGHPEAIARLHAVPRALLFMMQSRLLIRGCPGRVSTFGLQAS